MKISKSRMRQIIQEEMNRVENPGPYSKERQGFDKDLDGVPDGADKDPKDGSVQEQVTPDNIMLAIEAIGQVLSTPGVKEAALGGVLAIAMQYLQKYADKEAKIMTDRPEIAPEEM